MTEQSLRKENPQQTPQSRLVDYLKQLQIRLPDSELWLRADILTKQPWVREALRLGMNTNRTDETWRFFSQEFPEYVLSINLFLAGTPRLIKIKQKIALERMAEYRTETYILLKIIEPPIESNLIMPPIIPPFDFPDK